MKRSKQALAWLLSLLLAIGNLVLPLSTAMAAEPITLYLTADKTTLSPGDEVTISVSVSEVANIAGVAFSLQCDLGIFEFKAGSLVNDYRLYQRNKSDTDEKWDAYATTIQVDQANTTGISFVIPTNNVYGCTVDAGTALFQATYKVKEDAANGTTQFSINDMGHFLVLSYDGDETGTTVTPTIDASTITISGGVDPEISGTVALSPSSGIKIGDTITATPDITPASASLTYKWYRCTSEDGSGASLISGETNTTYTPQSATDVGKYIMVEITASGYSGTISSVTTGAVSKASRTAPSAPTLSAKTDTTVTLNTIAGDGICYGYNTINSAPAIWQEGHTFSNLSPNTTYYFFAKYNGTSTHLESSPSSALTVTTEKEHYTITVSGTGAGGSVDVTKGDSNVTTAQEGASITLTATPNTDYYFDGWASTSATLSGNSDNPATFTMPANAVNITVTFTQKSQPVLSLGAQAPTTYTGNPIPYSGTISVASGSTGSTDGWSYTTTYKTKGDSGDGITTAPTNAGEYTAIVRFEGNDKNKSATATTDFTITKASQTKPVAPTVSAVAPSNMTITTVAGQMYIVLPASDPVPSPTTKGWVLATDTSYKWTGLTPGTAYKVYTYKPYTVNYDNSQVSNATASNTINIWLLTAWDGTNLASSLDFSLRTNYQSVTTKIISLLNEGTGALTGVDVVLGGTDADKFVLDKTNLSADLLADEATSFTIKPDVSIPEGIYSATLTISSTQNEPGNNETVGISDIVINLRLEVVDKVVVTIGGLNDRIVTYNASPQSILKTSVTATPASGSFSTSALEYEYANSNYGPSLLPPTDAGIYTVTARVPLDNSEYVGSATATLTISPKELTVTGMQSAAKTYDGTTDAQVSGGTLSGVINNDDVTISQLPTTGTFASANQGINIPVSVPTITLSGTDKDNYVLLAPVLSGTITPKSVRPIVAIADKIYDATPNIPGSLISVSFAAGDIVGDDSVTVTYSSGAYTDKNVENGKSATVYTQSVVGNGNGNYVLLAPDAFTGNILPKSVDVIISGNAKPVYDGVAKALSANYAPIGSDAQSVTVLYDGLATAPSAVGIYSITATINDPNYVLGNVSGITSLEIIPGLLTSTNVAIAIAQGSEKTVNTSEFKISAPAGSVLPTGTYELGNVDDSNGILDVAPTLVSGVITIKLLPNATLGDKATIPVEFIPEANTYESVTSYIVVTASEESYTTSIVNAPASVKLGEELDLTSTKIRTVFDGDTKPLEEEDVTATMVSGYDKDATGAGALGSHVVTVTDSSGRTVSFTVLVEDVVVGITLTPPTKTNYQWKSETTLDLSGGLLTLDMRSQLTVDDVYLSLSMIPDIPNMDQLGNHTVTVEYEGFADTFTIIVEQAGIPVTANPLPGDSGVVSLAKDAEFRKELDGSPVDANDVFLIIKDIPDANITTLRTDIAGIPAFNSVPSTNLMFVDISLEDSTGNKVQPTQSIRIQLPYPAGSDSTCDFVIYHKHSDGSTETITPARTANGLEFSISYFSEFVIGWYKQAERPGGTGASSNYTRSTAAEQRQKDFWNAVASAINSASPGSIINANARSYDQMPASVMEALRNSNVTLIISWDGGVSITITSKNALKPEDLRAYYPLSMLVELYMVKPPKTDDPEEGEAWLRSQIDATNLAVTQAMVIGNNMVVDVIAPDVEADKLTSFTPVTAGLIASISNPEAVHAPVGAIMEDGEANTTNSMVWLYVLIALLLAGSAFYINEKEKRSLDQ